jgi:ubiquinone/menaquinone biosynthesis C-methylase UbiE
LDLLRGKIVADVGAGSGKLAFILAEYAKTVFAIEPISSFRRFIKEEAKRTETHNVFAIDGFLDSIPFPENSFDILFTSNAIGWNLDKELQEIDRVVKQNGYAIHLLRTIENETDNPFHNTFLSNDWEYKFFTYPSTTGVKLKYMKTVKKPR